MITLINPVAIAVIVVAIGIALYGLDRTIGFPKTEIAIFILLFIFLIGAGYAIVDSNSVDVFTQDHSNVTIPNAPAEDINPATCHLGA